MKQRLLLALLRQEDGIVPPIVERIGGDAGKVAAGAEALVRQTPRIYGETAQLLFSSEVGVKASIGFSAFPCVNP